MITDSMIIIMQFVVAFYFNSLGKFAWLSLAFCVYDYYQIVHQEHTRNSKMEVNQKMMGGMWLRA